ncbi:MAG: hypothetical protein JJW01_03580 [Alphaproteobacteria bacterium]|nr:hypothetical protein [Rickettsiales bacterium]
MVKKTLIENKINLANEKEGKDIKELEEKNIEKSKMQNNKQEFEQKPKHEQAEIDRRSKKRISTIDTTNASLQ